MPTINGDAGPNSLSDTTDADIINGLGGDDTITFNELNAVTTTTDTADGGADNDTLELDYLAVNSSFLLQSGNFTNFGGGIDVDFFSIERFIVRLGSGQSFIVLGSGDDEVSLGGGEDFVDVGSGTNIADGGAGGTDRISANLSADTLGITWDLVANTYTGPGSYTNFEVFQDIITGSGNDTLLAGTQGPSTPGTINVGVGNDSVTIRSAGAYDVIGGSGSDRLIVIYSFSTEGVSAFGTPAGGGGFDGTVSNGFGAVVDFFGIEHFSITTSSGDEFDQLTLYSGDDFASLGPGNDTVDFGTGNNSGDGGTGSDLVSVDMSAATAAISWDLPANSYSGPAGTSFTNFERFGTVRTGSGNDSINPGATNANIHTGGGQDTVTLSAGYHFVFAGSGSDTLVLEYGGAVTAIVTSLGPFADGNGFSGNYNPNPSALGVQYTGIDRFVITTGSGNDSISTATGNDIVSTGAGNDFVNVATGTDQADGGTGTDSIRADMSAATTAILWNIQTNSYSGPVGSSFTNFESFFELFTGSGNDVIVTSFSAAPEEVVTLGGNDTVTVGGGFDTIFDNAGVDTLIVDYSANTTGVATSVAPAFNAGTQGFGGEYDAGATGRVSYTGFDRFLITTGSGVDNIVTADGNDSISTGAANDTLNGGAGDDTLDGGAGADAMTGGAGNDTFTVDDAGDSTAEAAGGGTDLVLSSITHTLGANVDNLTLTGVAPINGTGNGLANTIIGNSAANTLNGAGGADTMRGGDGNDIYRVDNVGDKAIEQSAGGGTDEVRSTVSFTLGANVENLTLLSFGIGAPAIDGTGNALDNVIIGNNAANILNGAGGADSMTGNGGDDTYFVDNAGDQVAEAAGGGSFDLVRSTISYTLGAEVERLTLTGAAATDGTGNDLANVITGNAAANRIDGGLGVDKMRGGGGNDTYVVERASDTVIEDPGAGTDAIESSVTYTLPSNVETLILTGTAAIDGTGNFAANTITGNVATNILNGAAGADVMNGGAGDDTYFVDNVGDQAVEASGEGTDLVRSNVSFTLVAFVENLTLTGGLAINGTGNALANVINGNLGANTLDGAGGADKLNGKAGNDTYVVDDLGDQVTEDAANGGVDLVQSSVTFTLGLHVDNLTLTGAAAVNGTGNGTVNILIGNDADNFLDGRGHDDTLVGGGGDDDLRGFTGLDHLTGGAGMDDFIFDTVVFAGNADTIADFEVGVDKIKLDNAVFTGLPAGALNANAFKAGTAATDADDRIIYDAATGRLWFDSDGVGGAAQILFADLANAPTGLSAGDFTVI